MGSRERLAAIVREARKINTTLFADKGEGPKELLAKMGEMSVAQITDAILASDWLRDTLAAERERCAAAVKRFGDCVTSGSIHPANKRAQDADLALCDDIADFIRNLEPEAIDDRG